VGGERAAKMGWSYDTEAKSVASVAKASTACKETVKGAPDESDGELGGPLAVIPSRIVAQVLLTADILELHAREVGVAGGNRKKLCSVIGRNQSEEE
jgi:hypothetical protein